PEPEPLHSSPSTPTATQSKRAKALQDRKDWVFMQPEEMMAVPTVDDLLNLAPLEKKEQGKEKLSPLESYLNRLYHPEEPNAKKTRYGELDPFGALRKKDRNRDKEHDKDAWNENADQTDPDLPEGVRETQHNLQKKLSDSAQGFGVVSAPKHQGIFSDIF